MDDIVIILKALSDKNRLKTVCALEEGRLCACQIIELLGLAPSTVSRHMNVLEHAGLIKGSKQERWVYYELAGKEAANPAGRLMKLLGEMFLEMDEAKDIKKETERIKSISPEELCRKKKAKGS